MQLSTASRWVVQLSTASHEKKLDANLRLLERTPPIIVDEVGCLPLDAGSPNLFVQLISSCYVRASLIVTKIKPFSAWEMSLAIRSLPRP